MITYSIIAIAFAIMYHIRYTHEVLGIVRDTLVLLDMENEKSGYNPIVFSILFFLFNCLAMPFMFIYIVISTRKDVLKDMTAAVMKSFMKLDEK